MIYGNSIGTEIDRTFIIQDANGNELVATIVDKQIVFDATPNDIRMGKVAATQNGVVTGEKEIPAYHTREGFKIITAGSSIKMATVDYDYSKMQAVICPYSSSLNGSVGAEYAAINDSVYPVKTTTAIAEVTKIKNTMEIDFGMTNDFGVPCLIRYFMYKEVY